MLTTLQDILTAGAKKFKMELKGFAALTRELVVDSKTTKAC